MVSIRGDKSGAPIGLPDYELLLYSARGRNAGKLLRSEDLFEESRIVVWPASCVECFLSVRCAVPG